MEQARRRLVFEELLILQLSLLKAKGINTKQKGNKFKTVDINPLLNKLTFKLTSAQKKVFEEICNDMQSDKKMNRLIQGDVSWKGGSSYGYLFSC